MEELGKIEKFILGYIWYEYFGKLYFSRGSASPEEFIAQTIADEILKNQKFRETAVKKFSEALKKLEEYWMIQVSGFEASLTSYGQQVVKQLPKDVYKKLKEEISQGRF